MKRSETVKPGPIFLVDIDNISTVFPNLENFDDVTFSLTADVVTELWNCEFRVPETIKQVTLYNSACTAWLRWNAVSKSCPNIETFHFRESLSSDFLFLPSVDTQREAFRDIFYPKSASTSSSLRDIRTQIETWVIGPGNKTYLDEYPRSGNNLGLSLDSCLGMTRLRKLKMTSTSDDNISNRTLPRPINCDYTSEFDRYRKTRRRKEVTRTFDPLLMPSETRKSVSRRALSRAAQPAVMIIISKYAKWLNIKTYALQLVEVIRTMRYATTVTCDSKEKEESKMRWILKKLASYGTIEKLTLRNVSFDCENLVPFSTRLRSLSLKECTPSPRVDVLKSFERLKTLKLGTSGINWSLPLVSPMTTNSNGNDKASWHDTYEMMHKYGVFNNYKDGMSNDAYLFPWKVLDALPSITRFSMHNYCLFPFVSNVIKEMEHYMEEKSKRNTFFECRLFISPTISNNFNLLRYQ